MAEDAGGGGASKTMDLGEKSEYSNRVSRLRGVMGAEALAKLTTSSVLVVGLGGLGVEVAKNVILTGVKACTLFDKSLASNADLASQFFISEKDVGKPRAEASLSQLQTLNPYTTVSLLKGEIDAAVIAKFTVVVVTECSYERQLQINDFCRAGGVKFIAADTVGVFGRTFCDFGPSFTVVDQNGETASECVLNSVTVDEEGVATVTVDEEKRHNLVNGDFVTFKELQGLSGLNGCRPKQIKVTSPFTFTVTGCTGKGFSEAYKQGGIVIEVKQPREMKFRSLRECLKEPGELMIYDFAKFSAPQNIHLAFATLDAFHKTYGDYPEPFNSKHEAEFIAIAQKLQSNNEAKSKDLDAETSRFIQEMCRTCRGRLNPLTATFGGIVGQEVLKACSAKFTPICQFLYMDFCEMLPSRDAADPFAVTCAADVAPRGNRYDGQTAVIGHKLQQALCCQNYFLVGAGAIGCEMLKNWALMGVGADRGMIHVTDMDRIERSNLSRQFLFHEEHIGELKSTSAAMAAQAMNPSLNIRAYDMAVGKATEHHFNEDFIESLDALVTALDNVEARLYVDDRAIQFCKPMIDSGTLGAKGSTQVVVPRMTVHYGAERDPPAASVALCTLKSFPYRIEHTIQWAKNWFNGSFTKVPSNCDNYLKTGGNFVDALDSNQKLRILNDILNYFTPVDSVGDHSSSKGGYARTFADCVAWARLRFEELYTNDIAQLLHKLPPNKVVENGQKFWSGTKRCPKPLRFDKADATHMAFIVSAANLHAASNGVPAQERTTDENQIRSILADIKIPSFSPVDGVTIAVTEEDAAKEETGEPTVLKLDDEVAQLRSKIDAAIKARDHAKLARVFDPAEFEKDDDTNFHVDFMTACSNLRARNYGIEEVDRHKTKMTAGNIIPAIATTTATVTGLVCVELIKVIQKKSIQAYKQANINLAVPMVLQFEPKETAKIVYKEHEFTPWDTIDVPGPKTLQQFIDFLESKYSVEVSMLSYGNSILYSFFASAKKRKARLPMPIEDIIAEVTKSPVDPGQKFILLDPYCNDEDGEDVDLPQVRYVRP